MVARLIAVSVIAGADAPKRLTGSALDAQHVMHERRKHSIERLDEVPH